MEHNKNCDNSPPQPAFLTAKIRPRWLLLPRDLQLMRLAHQMDSAAITVLPTQVMLMLVPGTKTLVQKRPYQSSTLNDHIFNKTVATATSAQRTSVHYSVEHHRPQFLYCVRYHSMMNGTSKTERHCRSSQHLWARAKTQKQFDAQHCLSGSLPLQDAHLSWRVVRVLPVLVHVAHIREPDGIDVAIDHDLRAATAIRPQLTELVLNGLSVRHPLGGCPCPHLESHGR